MQGRGHPTPRLYELPPEEAGTFRASIAALKEGNKYAASVYVYDEHEYKDMRLFMTDDGKAGVALKGDEIVSVFSRRDSSHSGCAQSLISTAVAAGGRRLDCFDTVLPKIYAEEGFVPAARLRWNDDYAPPGWDNATYRRYNQGRPDVVFMAYQPAAVDSAYNPAQGRYVAGYDAGVAAAARDAG